MATTYTGGCFAPPLTDDLFAEYEGLLSTVVLSKPSPLRDAFQTCLTAVNKWWLLPESSGNEEGNHSLNIRVVGLDQEIKDALYDLIPWDHEIEAYKAMLDGIDNPTVRNAFAHLLWHVVELNNDREPVTRDKVGR